MEITLQDAKDILISITCVLLVIFLSVQPKSKYDSLWITFVVISQLIFIVAIITEQNYTIDICHGLMFFSSVAALFLNTKIPVYSCLVFLIGVQIQWVVTGKCLVGCSQK